MWSQYGKHIDSAKRICQSIDITFEVRNLQVNNGSTTLDSGKIFIYFGINCRSESRTAEAIDTPQRGKQRASFDHRWFYNRIELPNLDKSIEEEFDTGDNEVPDIIPTSTLVKRCLAVLVQNLEALDLRE